jgi:hypothetical protein
MSWSLDARVPVIFAPASSAGADDAVLMEEGPPAPPGRVVARLSAQLSAGHPAGCLCCVPRGEAGRALGALFQARARGEVVFFRRVVADVIDQAAVRAALATDPLAAAHFRIAE